MKIDRIHAAEDVAAEAELDNIISEVTAPLEAEVAQARLEAGAATTQLAAKANEYQELSEQNAGLLRQIAELTANTQTPIRPSFGSPGKKTRITTPGALINKTVLGWLEVAVPGEFLLQDVDIDVSTDEKSQVFAVAVDTRVAVMGKYVFDGVRIFASHPSDLLNGINGGNLVITNLETSDVVDGINVHDGSLTVTGWKGHPLAQWRTSPIHADGAHCDHLQVGRNVGDVVLSNFDLDAGKKDQAPSLSVVMFSPGAPRTFHAYDGFMRGGYPPINIPGAYTSQVVDMRLTNVIFDTYPDAYGGAAIIAPSAFWPKVQAGTSRMLDGSVVSFKKGS